MKGIKLTRIKKSHIDKHTNHQCDAVPTPELRHYAKLVCRDCGGTWLKWLTRSEAEILLGPQTKKKPQSKATNWASTKPKEREFYKSYQQPKFDLPRTPTQLIGDRLALAGYSRYNGNSIYSIPPAYLQTLLDNNRITRREDRQQLQAAIELQQKIGA